MFRKLGKKTILAASLALAGGAIFGTAASARIPPRDPVCDQRVANECVTTWQSLGFWDYDNCVGYQQCMQCPPIPGYMCGGLFAATDPDEGTKPW
ncbi:MAG: hypothetical protein QOJ91_2166 [Sphingomonadales bacterium]|jgi:hypothetical protein|nr:hypothetical protein [Sphingomonadales bacterium]